MVTMQRDLSQTIVVRPVDPQDRQQLANLIHFETRVHRHLDWRPPMDWIGYSPYLVAEEGRRMVAALICPPYPPEVAWIRLFAVASIVPAQETWTLLWRAAQNQLSALETSKFVALPIQRWFRELLEHNNFQHTRDVVILSWEGSALPPKPGKLPKIRLMRSDDLPEVANVDAASFEPEWRNSIDNLAIAFKQSAIAAVAEDETGLIGYQISTASPPGGHLARLAVAPQMQGRGIGFALVYHLLETFQRLGVNRITVNTQKDNLASLAVYSRAGFRRTGESYPVYEAVCC